MHSDHFTWRPGGAPLILQDPWGPSYWFTVFGPPDPKLIIGNVQGGSSAPIWWDPITRILSFIFYDAADTGQFLLHLISRPHHANFVFPLSPPGTPGFGPTVTAALKPGTFTTCAGFGRRLSRHNFSYGPITSAYSLQGAPASPEQIDQILNGGSVSTASILMRREGSVRAAKSREMDRAWSLAQPSACLAYPSQQPIRGAYPRSIDRSDST